MARSMLLVALLLGCRGEDEPTDPGSPDASEPTGETGPVDPTAETGTSGPTGTLPSGPRPPNVLIVLSDDQGVDKVSSYQGHPSPPPTPNLDALAAQGVSFDRAYALPSCSPSRGALLTGKVPHRTGLGEVIQYYDDEELPIDTYTLPRMLEASPWPWRTAVYGKWHLSSYVSGHDIEHPLMLGFDDFAGSMGNLQDAVLEPGERHTYTFWDKVEDGKVHVETTYATTDTVDHALEAMGTLPEPWLLYLPFNAPHTPVHIPPEGLADEVTEVTSANLVDAAVQALDSELGRLFAAVDLEDTLVIFAGDNGTSEYGVQPPLDPARAKLTAFEGGVHVPMIVAGPGVVHGQRTAALVHLLDVLPTVAEAARVDLATTGEVFDGRSLWPQLVDPAAPGREMLHVGYFLPNGAGAALRSEMWLSHGARFKLARENRGVLAFVDLVDDPDETVFYPSVASIPAEHQAEAQALLEAQEAFFQGITVPTW